jgi:hypothetical protein
LAGQIQMPRERKSAMPTNRWLGRWRVSRERQENVVSERKVSNANKQGLEKKGEKPSFWWTSLLLVKTTGKKWNKRKQPRWEEVEWGTVAICVEKKWFVLKFQRFCSVDSPREFEAYHWSSLILISINVLRLWALREEGSPSQHLVSEFPSLAFFFIYLCFLRLLSFRSGWPGPCSRK